MEQFFTNAWRNQAWWLWLLLPVSWLYRLVTWLNKKSYDIGLKKIYYPPVPVIVIGNITVGGSGKTPLIIALVQYLQAKNIQVGVISRGYGGNTAKMPALVTPNSTPAEVGDEPCLIVQSLIVKDTALLGQAVPMAVCPNRGQAIELILKNHPNIQLILADDGLQHHALDRDKNWIVVDSDRGFGNAQVLPVGFLREPIKRLYQPDTTVIFHQKDWQKNSLSILENKDLPKLLMKLEEQPLQSLFSRENNSHLPFEKKNARVDWREAVATPNEISPLKSEFLRPQQFPQVIAMTGIGYPQRFFDSVKNLGFAIIEMPFNDHHDFSLEDFSLSDFSNLSQDLPIIVTAKDAVKIRLLLQSDDSEFSQRLKGRIWVLPVVAKLSDTVWRELDKQLVELGIG